MFSRLLASRGTLLFFMSQTLIMTGVIVSGYIFQLAKSPQAIVVKKMYEDSDTIAILLIAIGVLLECREILLKRFLRECRKDDASLHLSAVDHDLEYYGVVLLILGLTMELIVAITKYLNEHAHGYAFYSAAETSFNVFTIGILCTIMTVSFVLMIRVGVLIFKLRKRP